MTPRHLPPRLTITRQRGDWMRPETRPVVVLEVKPHALVLLVGKTDAATFDRASWAGHGDWSSWRLCRELGDRYYVEAPGRVAREAAHVVDIEAAQALLDAGLTIYAAAQRLGIGRQSLTNALRRAGIR